MLLLLLLLLVLVDSEQSKLILTLVNNRVRNNRRDNACEPSVDVRQERLKAQPHDAKVCLVRRRQPR